MLTVLILAIILLTIVSAFLSCLEVALFSIPQQRIRRFAESDKPEQRLVATLLKNSKSLIVTIFLSGTLMNVLVQNISSSISEGGSHGWFSKIVLPFLIVLIFSDIFPKYIGILYGEFLALKAARIIYTIHMALKPITYVITKVAEFFSKILFFFLKPELPLRKQELVHIIQDSAKKDLLHAQEAALIHGFLTIADLSVKEIMIPKASLPGYDITAPLSKLIHLFDQSGFTEIAVFEKAEGNFIGTIAASDFLHQKDLIHTGEELRPIIKKPFFIPETTSGKKLLQEMKSQNIFLAVAIDEHRMMSGIVSENTFLSSITKSLETTNLTKKEHKTLQDGTIIVNSSMPLSDLNTLWDLNLTSQYGMVTVGGWITEQLGRIPQNGSTYETKEVSCKVLVADVRKTVKIHLKKLKTSGS